MKQSAAAALLLLTFFPAGAASLAANPARPNSPARTAFFESKIRPLLLERCAACHGEKVQQASLRLDTPQGLSKGADTGPVITPGNPEKSSLIQAVRYAGPPKMPPAGKLRPDEIAALEQWVQQGAEWPTAEAPGHGTVVPECAAKPHWSFQPVRRPALPRVKNQHWVRTPVDAFILAKLEAKGLSPAPPADPRTLIRRVTFDLTGLPPTPEEVEQFVQDCRQEASGVRRQALGVKHQALRGEASPRKISAPNLTLKAQGLRPSVESAVTPKAYARLVDRLLASPAYGERWGRHWLDVVRYADTAGETADYPVREAYRYRDYVIQSFNADKPYDQFIREQVAGDLLAASVPKERYGECIAATGFLAISRRFGFDPQNYQHLTIDDTIDTLGKSILGLSLGCARCHDHKYDPVPTKDYYGLYGIFASTRYAFPGSEEVKRPRDFVPLVAPSERAQRQQEFDTRLKSLDQESAALEGARNRARAEVGLDGDFEFQEPASLPGIPWENGPNSPARIDPAAQSPWTNVFPSGTQGLRFANAGGYSGFGQRLAAPWSAAGTRYLYYNAEFHLSSVAAGGGGSFRFYAGHGPGNSAAVELFVNGEQFFVRNGSRVDPVRPVKVGEWYQLSLILDLRDRVFSGYVGVPGNLTLLPTCQFAANWDGTIDYFFVDSYGHLGGVRPGLDVDNLTIRDTPFAAPAAGKSAPSVAGEGRARLRTELKKTEERLSAVQRERTDLTERGPFPVAYAVTEGTPLDAHVLRRGDPLNVGEVVPRHFPTVLGGQTLPPGAGSGRLQLAEWLTSPANPLTARVLVNRVWQHHFGTGIVRTPNDFGKRGATPTHPELLDWLAAAFSGVPGSGFRVPGSPSTQDNAEPGTRNPEPQRSGVPGSPSAKSNAEPGTQNSEPSLGWSLKRLHRLILLSSAYQQSSEAPVADPENRLLARQNRRRLEAEAIRDAMLAVSGNLDPRAGGEHPFPPVSTWGFSQHTPFTAVYETRQRSVYLMTQRIRKHPFLALFDGAEPNASTPERVATTTPLQALFMMNDPFAHEQAGQLATRLLKERSEDSARIERAYRLCFGRAPSAEEGSRSRQFLTQAAAALKASGIPAQKVEYATWSSFARALLSSNEFLFID